MACSRLPLKIRKDLLLGVYLQSQVLPHATTHNRDGSEEITSGLARYAAAFHTSSTALRDCPRTWVSRKRETCVKPQPVSSNCNQKAQQKTLQTNNGESS